MAALSTVEHQRAHRQAKDRRNASARVRRRKYAEAMAWCQAMQARVEREPHGEGWLYRVSVPGFHPAWAAELWWAVEQLDANIAAFCDSPQASKGPTGAKLDHLRALRAQRQEAS